MQSVKQKLSIFYLPFYYCSLLKYKSKRKRLLPHYVTTDKLVIWIMNMDSNNELKEIDIKNCTCYYFDDIFKIYNLDTDNILID